MNIFDIEHFGFRPQVSGIGFAFLEKNLSFVSLS